MSITCGIGTVVNVLILLSLAIITMHLYGRRLHDVDVRLGSPHHHLAYRDTYCIWIDILLILP